MPHGCPRGWRRRSRGRGRGRRSHLLGRLTRGPRVLASALASGCPHGPGVNLDRTFDRYVRFDAKSPSMP